jgi:hypothetical protein
MAVTANRSVTVTLTGDVDYNQTFSAVENADSPGQIDIVTLASGANTITPPSGGTTPVAVTIIPPAGNTQTITLKGITGDTGIALSKTDPTTIGLGSSSATFVLTAGADIEGVRLIWT